MKKIMIFAAMMVALTSMRASSLMLVTTSV